MKIEQSWIDWAQRSINSIKDGGCITYPDGAIFIVDHSKRVLELVCCKKEWLNSQTEKINDEVFARINYKCFREKNCPTSPQEFIKNIVPNLQKYSPTSLNNIFKSFTDVFGVSQEDIEKLMKKTGKRLPINPVTIRGFSDTNSPGNLSIGRTWISSSSIMDASYKFDPSSVGPRYDKYNSLVLWKHENDKNKVGMLVDESEFLDLVEALNSKEVISVNIWGVPHKGSTESLCMRFEKKSNEDKDENLLVAVFKGGDKKVNPEYLRIAKLNYCTFIEGLRHLFPNGELPIEIPD